MKAVWYEAVGPAREALRFGEQPLPTPAEGEVRVRLACSGINPSDVKTRSGLRGPLAVPLLIPHSDGAGVIDAVGAGVPMSRIGERVWLWNAAWKRGHGTAAEYCALPAAHAVPLPAVVDFAQGACLGIPAMTAAHALFADGDIAGQTVLVTGGAGSVGNAAIQLARFGGARVITTVSSAAKAEVAAQAGAEHVLQYREDDVAERVLALTDGRGVDRIVEVEFGGNLATSVRVIRTGGVIAAYGSMAAPNPSLPFYELMFRHVTLRLLFVYTLDAVQRRVAIERIDAALRAGRLRPRVGARFPLAEAAAAHEAVESGKLIGQVVLDID